MPSLDETSPHLIAHLRALMNEYGPRGVYDTCAQLINEVATPPDAVLPDPRVADAMASGRDVIELGRPHTTDQLRNSPYAGTFADVVAASQTPAPPGRGSWPPGDALDPAPVQTEVHVVTPESFDSHDDWQQWRAQHGIDPQNVGPMGNR